MPQNKRTEIGGETHICFLISSGSSAQVPVEKGRLLLPTDAAVSCIATAVAALAKGH